MDNVTLLSAMQRYLALVNATTPREFHPDSMAASETRLQTVRANRTIQHTIRPIVLCYHGLMVTKTLESRGRFWLEYNRPSRGYNESMAFISVLAVVLLLIAALGNTWWWRPATVPGTEAPLSLGGFSSCRFTRHMGRQSAHCCSFGADRCGARPYTLKTTPVRPGRLSVCSRLQAAATSHTALIPMHNIFLSSFSPPTGPWMPVRDHGAGGRARAGEPRWAPLCHVQARLQGHSRRSSRSRSQVGELPGMEISEPPCFQTLVNCTCVVALAP